MPHTFNVTRRSDLSLSSCEVATDEEVLTPMIRNDQPRVAKNSLVKIASKETPYEALVDYFKGPTAIIFSKDPIAGIKVVKKYADENEKFKVVKASLSQKIIDEEEFIQLSKLSSLEDLRSEIASYLLAPHQNLVQLLNAAGTELVGIFNNYSKKN